MKNLALLILIGSLPYCMTAQSGSVKGRLTDSTGQLLNNATISIMQKRDSSFVSYGMSDANGSFEIKNLGISDYHLFISFTGYETYQCPFSISLKRRVADMGFVVLMPEYKTLTGVVVTDVTPVKINGDTISFKANAFNSKPDATVEDVLKKIPGVQVQKDGTIKTQGEQVQKIYVDGKEFFGNDPKVATKNLTADMVDQIQVFDDMSEQSRFTKLDDGSRTKSINIKLKKSKRKGDFGRATAGIGTDSRYEGNFSLNHFRGNRRISFVGSANNTNKTNYTFNDYSSEQGSVSTPGSGMINSLGATAGGVNKPLAAGINYNDSWGPKIDFRASYFYSDNSSLLVQNKFRKNMFPGDSVSEISSYNSSFINNKNNKVSGRWEYMIDTMNSILYSVNLNKQRSESVLFDTSVTVSDATEKYIAAKSFLEKHDERDGMNYSGEFLFRKKFKRSGRTFTAGWRNGINNGQSNGTYKSPVTTFDPDGSIVSTINLDQRIVQDFESTNNTISASYTEPIGQNKLLEINYAYSNSNNGSNKKTYDFNNGSGKYDLFNPLLTNYFDYNNKSDRIALNFRHKLRKLNYQLGIGVQGTQLINESTDGSGNDTTILQRFTNLFPTANFSFAFSRSKNLRMYYKGRTNSPTLIQLQDVPDVTNPMVIKTGNPSLKQEFAHYINLNYNAFTLTSDQYFSASLSVNYTGNKIVNSIDSLNEVTVIYRPENMNGSFNGSGSASFNFPWKNSDNLSVTISNLMYLSRDANLVYKEKNFTTVFQLNQIAGVNYNNDIIDLSLNTGFVYNNVAYNLDKNSNTNYFNFTYSADFTYRFKGRFYFASDFDHYINSGRTPGYNQDIFLWNMSLAKKLFKTSGGEIKLTVYDILKQNTGASRVIGENSYEDIRANIVPRFFLLSVSYNFNRSGQKQGATQ